MLPLLTNPCGNGFDIMNNLSDCLGANPTFNWTFRGLCSSLQVCRQTEELSEPYCIVFQLDEGKGVGHKLARILSTFLKIRLFRLFSSKHHALTTKVYGVYPSVENPVVIYEFQSEAERYVIDNVIPATNRNTASYLRGLVERITHINPALGGVALLMHKEPNVSD